MYHMYRVFSSRARHTAHLTKVHRQDVGVEDIVECSAAGPASPTGAGSGDEEQDIELDRASLSVFCCSDCLAAYKSLSEFTEHECQTRDDMEEVCYSLFYLNDSFIALLLYILNLGN